MSTIKIKYSIPEKSRSPSESPKIPIPKITVMTIIRSKCHVIVIISIPYVCPMNDLTLEVLIEVFKELTNRFKAVILSEDFHFFQPEY